jgi:adenine-specific DNA-methyltransferase
MDDDDLFVFEEKVFEEKECPAFLSEQIISYIGNKRKLLSFIDSAVGTIKKDLGKEKIAILDGFAGSGIVSRSLKQHASVLHSNDLEQYAEIIGSCYLSNKEDVDQNQLSEIIDELNNNKLVDREPGFISKLYAPENDDDIK